MNHWHTQRLTAAALFFAVACAVTMVWPGTARTDPGQVLFHQKISDTNGLFTGELDDGDQFAISVASLGDLNGDGVGDLATGAWLDDDLRENSGAVWVLFLNASGGVMSHQKISNTEGNLAGILAQQAQFGYSVTSLGDFDGPGGSVHTLAVGATLYDGSVNGGAVWLLFLNADGTVYSEQTISSTQGNFTGDLDVNDYFGSDVASLGDLDGDGVDDLAVGAWFDDDGGTNRGAVWILFLNANGTVNHHQKISDTEGGFLGGLEDQDRFGVSVCSLGDFDGVGGSARTLAVGAQGDDDGDLNAGAVWLLYLNTDGTVYDYTKISQTAGNFTGDLDAGDNFGGRGALAPLGDLNGDGVDDIAVGARRDDDSPLDQVETDRGALWLLFLNSDGTVNSHQKISDTQGNFSGHLDDEDWFGSAVVSLGDLDGAGESALTLAVGADHDDDGGENRGAVWMLFLCDAIQTCDPVSVDPGNVLPPVTFLSTQPNPFRTETSFRYSLPVANPVHVRIYDVNGQLVTTVVNESQSAGAHSASWDGRDRFGKPVVAGVYFVRLETGGEMQTGKVIKAH